eukprot:scaffold75938_cov57-Phaeocystis_antarctica.AAC.3
MPQRGVLVLTSRGPDRLRPRAERTDGTEGPPAGRAEDGGLREQAEARVRVRAVRLTRGLVRLNLEPQEVLQNLLC